MSGLDAPGFRIEIVGAVTDVLHRPDGYAVIGDGNHATRGVGWECEGFASKILQSVFVGELSLRKVALRQLGGEDFQVANRYANLFLTTLSNFFTHQKLTDMETCYKCFRRDIIQSVDLKEDRFGFEPEITAKISKMRIRIAEVPISYEPRSNEEGKKIGFKDGLRAIYVIFKYR